MNLAIIILGIITVLSLDKTRTAFCLDKENTVTIKGFCAICVILGHLTRIFSEGGVHHKHLLEHTVIRTSCTHFFLFVWLWNDVFLEI